MTMPMEAFPVSGDPAAVAEAAHALRDLAVRIGAIDARLHDLRTLGVWETPSGERFDAALRRLPDVLLLLQSRYRAASEALLTWSVDLRSAIHARAEAADRRLEARIELDAVERDLQAALLEPASAWYEELLSRQVRALRRAREAEEDIERVWWRHQEAAADCGQRLRAASQDTLVDSTTYAVLRDARAIAEGVGALAGIAALVPGPQQGLVAVAAAGGTSAMIGIDVALLIGYGDGSIWGIGQNAGVAISGRGARTLSQAAGVGAKQVNGIWRGQQLGTTRRIAQAHRELSTRLPAGQVRDEVRDKALRLNQRWQMATAGGANAVRLEVTSRAAHVASVAGTTTQQAEYVTRPPRGPNRAQREAWERVREPR